MSGVNLRKLREAVERRQSLALHQLREKSGSRREVWENVALWRLRRPEAGTVASYLTVYGYSAIDELQWNRFAEDFRKPCLEFTLSEHEEHAGHTWYLIGCTLTLGQRCRNQTSGEAFPQLCWKAPRRLAQIREDLHDTVRRCSWYEEFFASAPFALPFAPKGTTARIRAWLQAFAYVINSCIAEPYIAALTLQFLLAPTPVVKLGSQFRSVEREKEKINRSSRREVSRIFSSCDVADKSLHNCGEAVLSEALLGGSEKDHQRALQGELECSEEFAESPRSSRSGTHSTDLSDNLGKVDMNFHDEAGDDYQNFGAMQGTSVDCENFDIYSVRGDDTEQGDAGDALVSEDCSLYCWEGRFIAPTSCRQVEETTFSYLENVEDIGQTTKADAPLEQVGGEDSLEPLSAMEDIGQETNTEAPLEHVVGEDSLEPLPFMDYSCRHALLSEACPTDELSQENVLPEESPRPQLGGDGYDISGSFEEVPTYMLSLPVATTLVTDERPIEDTCQSSDTSESDTEGVKEACDIGASHGEQTSGPHLEDLPPDTEHVRTTVKEPDPDDDDWI